MLPGPTIIVLCPHCGQPWSYQTLMSGNTFGARYWTDGKQDAPMLPRNPPIVRCTGCSHFFWPEREDEVDTIFPYDEIPIERVPKRKSLIRIVLEHIPTRRTHEHIKQEHIPTRRTHEHIEQITEPTEAEYYEVLAAEGFDDKEDLLWIRTLAWQRSNDPYRDDDGAPDPKTRTDQWRENLSAMLNMLVDEDPSIARAEILRELGRFEDVRSALPDSPENPFVAAISNLSTAQEHAVAEVHFG